MRRRNVTLLTVKIKLTQVVSERQNPDLRRNFLSSKIITANICIHAYVQLASHISCPPPRVYAPVTSGKLPNGWTSPTFILIRGSTTLPFVTQTTTYSYSCIFSTLPPSYLPPFSSLSSPSTTFYPHVFICLFIWNGLSHGWEAIEQGWWHISAGERGKQNILKWGCHDKEPVLRNHKNLWNCTVIFFRIYSISISLPSSNEICLYQPFCWDTISY